MIERKKSHKKLRKARGEGTEQTWRARRDAEGVKKAEPELRRGPAELTAERKSVHKENWARGDAQPRGLRSAEAEAACGFGGAPKRERVARPTGRSREGCWAPRKSQGAPRERAGGRGPAPARLSHSSHLPLPPSPSALSKKCNYAF